MRVATLLLLLVAIAASVASAAERTGTIEGTVTDGGKPVANALVAAISIRTHEPAGIARSGTDGAFRLMSVPSGKYGVTVTAAGHTGGFTLDVVVTPASTTRAPVKLGGESMTISGSIVDDATGQRLRNAKLIANRYSDVDGDLFVIDVIDGAFHVALPPATYGLTARADGHSEERADVSKDTTTEVTFRLGKSWPPGPAPAEVVDWFRSHAVALSTVEAGHGFEDMRSLATAIGDARIVGLGEATHGTHEFFQLKHRMLEWLVTHVGFNVFAIEATMPEAFDINEYVLTGKGDPRKALAGLYFWTWDTDEVLDLIKWMRAWNENPKHPKVKFYGFDMQSAPRATKVVLDYIARVAPSETPALLAALAPLRNSLDAEAVPNLTPAAKESLKATTQALLARFDAERADWIKRSSLDAWTVARQHARILTQYLGEFFGAPGAAGDWRDKAMAENISWIVEHEGPNAKIVVWAHDGHVSHGSGTWHPMGWYLGQTFGKAYINVGFAFDHGSFRARDPDENYRLHTFTVASLPPGSFDSTLHATGVPRFVVDLRAAPSGIVTDWLRAQHGKRDYGSSFSSKWPMADAGLPTFARREFDLIAFVDETTSAQGLPEGNGGDAAVFPEPRNLDFEDVADGDRPRDWNISEQLPAFGWNIEATTRAPFHGHRCALIKRLPGRHYGERAGTFAQAIDAQPFRGKRVRLSGAVKADVHGNGSSARLTLAVRVQTTGAPSVSNVMVDHPATDPQWRTYSIDLDVPSSAGRLLLGAAVVGDGSACFDDLKLEVSGPR